MENCKLAERSPLLDDDSHPHLEQWAVGLTPGPSLAPPQRLMNSRKLVLHGGVWQVYHTLTLCREKGDCVFHGFLKFGGDKIKPNILPLCGTTRHPAPPSPFVSISFGTKATHIHQTYAVWSQTAVNRKPRNWWSPMLECKPPPCKMHVSEGSEARNKVKSITRTGEYLD